MPFAGKSPDPNPCMLFIVNFSFLIRTLEVSVLYNLRSGMKVYNAVLNVKPSGLSWLCLALQLVTPFLSNSLKALVRGTVTNGFLSVTSVLQDLVFKVSFQDVLFTAPSPSPGGDEKVIFIFQRGPVNYSPGLCTAYSLQLDEDRWNEEEHNLIFQGIKNVRWISDLTQPHSHVVETFI